MDLITTYLMNGKLGGREGGKGLCDREGNVALSPQQQQDVLETSPGTLDSTKCSQLLDAVIFTHKALN